MKLKYGDFVKLSEHGVKDLHNDSMSINERIYMTRLLNHGGKVNRVFEGHVEVVPFEVNGELGSGSWLMAHTKIIQI